MNRWFGNSDDSLRQAADRENRAAARNSGAARRVIAQQPSLVLSESEEDDFGDCNTTLGNLSLKLDGNEDLSDTDSTANSTMADAAELARQMALPVDTSDYDNDPESWKKEVKHKFDEKDVKYTFNCIESQMKKHGINR